jgi:hypothetical protein
MADTAQQTGLFVAGGLFSPAGTSAVTSRELIELPGLG